MTHDTRADAQAIFAAAVNAVDPEKAVESCLSRDSQHLNVQGRTFDLTRFERVIVVGAGKAGAPMALALERILGDRITTGLIIVKYGHALPLRKITTREAGHPVPDENGLAGARAVLALLESCNAQDLVISVISGGGSALLPLPPDGITLDEKQTLTSQLLACGATIHELNTVRKHISRTKGGGLARAAYPATVINLMLSDVVGDDMDTIASGPFVPDHTTSTDAINVLNCYNLWDTTPTSIRTHLLHTPTTPPPSFGRITNLIVGSNRLACFAAQSKAQALGYHTLILSTLLEGDTTTVALTHTAIAREILASNNPIPTPACIISGGETTVVLKGHGKGGRNQEFALVCAQAIADIPAEITCLSAGTDGTDGPTDAAGGIVDTHTVNRGTHLNLDIATALNNNDAYPYLEATGDLLKTGPTRTNVMDIHIVLVPGAKAEG